MTRHQVYTFIGMSINAEKQLNEARNAIAEETGIYYTAVNFYAHTEIHVCVDDMKIICDTLSERPEKRNSQCTEYLFELFVMVEGVEVFCICRSLPEWAI